MVDDILRKRAERLFSRRGGAVTDNDLLDAFKVIEIKRLQRAGFIRPSIDDDLWFWAMEEMTG